MWEERYRHIKAMPLFCVFQKRIGIAFFRAGLPDSYHDIMRQYLYEIWKCVKILRVRSYGYI